MPSSLELVVDLSQLRPHPFRDRDAPEPEPPVLDLPQICVNPRKSNVSGFPRPRAARRRAAYRPNSISRVLSGMQLQPELREPLAKIGQEPPRILPMLETRR